MGVKELYQYERSLVFVYQRYADVHMGVPLPFSYSRIYGYNYNDYWQTIFRNRIKIFRFLIDK